MTAVLHDPRHPSRIPARLDRLAPREYPGGYPSMYQTWAQLAFLHWPFPVAELRARVPFNLEIDTFDGMAWVGIVPFTMTGVRPRGVPAVPGLSDFHELNVRTYVHAGGVPGVWFFSLDAASSLAVWAARTFFHLPYYKADIRLRRAEERVEYVSHRTDPTASPASFEAVWRVGAPIESPVSDTLEFFLTERYCLYAQHKGRVRRHRVRHAPWPLRRASLDLFDSTMLEAAGLPTPDGPPLVHAADPIAVTILAGEPV